MRFIKQLKIWKTSSKFSTLKYPFPEIKNFNSLSQNEIPQKLKRVQLINPSQIQKIANINQKEINEFKKNNKVSVKCEKEKVQYVNFFKYKKNVSLKSQSTLLSVSKLIETQKTLSGVLSQIFSSTYSFPLKTTQDKKQQPKIFYSQIPKIQQIIQLAHCKSYARQIANQRANVATPEFLQKQCWELAKQNNLDIKIIKGQQLQKSNFHLLNAVGRASINKPRIINMSYKGNPQNSDWIAFIGKGLCFDSGGLNIKVGNGMLGMHLDKHGAASVMSALRAISRLKIKLNITASFGFVQNSINENAYRPTDIITSRKGLTVQIGNTDAQGRLTLADVMNWTQQVYKPKKLIQLSTLTGAIVIALGKEAAGLWGNDNELIKRLQQAGLITQQKLWNLPILQQHRENVKSKYADLTNSSGQSSGSSCQAAAFLEAFVQKQTKWAHIDIAGASMNDIQATGYGGKLLVKYAQLQEQSQRKNI